MSKLFVLTLIASITLTCCATQKGTIINTPLNGDPNTPPMLSPKIQRVWIPDKISDDGRHYEKGHYSYEIERGTVWTMP